MANSNAARKPEVNSGPLPLNPARFMDASFQRNIWEALPPLGTKLEDMLKPEYWMHLGVNLKMRDRIEVFAEDSSWYAELIVLNASRLWAKVAVIRHIDLSGEDTEVLDDDELEGYEINWGGPTHKFRVIKDGEVLMAKFANKKEAQLWQDNHVRNMRQTAAKQIARET